MRLIANLVHLLTGGFILSAGWLTAAFFTSWFAVTRPLAATCLQLAVLCLWPCGRGIVREKLIGDFQEHVRTGMLPGSGVAHPSARGTCWAQVVLWLPLGIALMVAHMAHAIITALPTFANPWRSRSASLVGAAAFPLGWRVARLEQVRAVRAAGGSRRRQASDLEDIDVLGEACRRLARPLATVGCAGLILWASSSANEALLYSPPLRFEPPRQSPLQANWARSQPIAALLLVAQGDPLAAAEKDCPSPADTLRPAQLSRKQAGYALPLGSRPMQVPAGQERVARLRNVQEVVLFADWARHAKARSTPCIAAITKRIARTIPFASAHGMAERPTRKAPPETAAAIPGKRPVAFGEGEGRAIQLRKMQRIQRMAGSISNAKDPGVLRSDPIAYRIAKAATLAARSPVLEPVR